MYVPIGDHVVRNLALDDALSIATYADNPRVAANLRDSFPHPYAPADAEEFLGHILPQDPPRVFAIATETEAIGIVGLTLGEDVHRYTAELGYWLGEPFWGKGIVAAAVRAVVEYGFSELGLFRVYAEPFAPNAASARVLEKAGFTYEGCLRKNVLKHGRVLDQLLYAIVREGAVDNEAAG